MTTITIETEGQPPIVITVGHSNTMTVSKKDYLTHPQPHPLSPPAMPYRPRPQLLRHHLDGKTASETMRQVSRSGSLLPL